MKWKRELSEKESSGKDSSEEPGMMRNGCLEMWGNGLPGQGASKWEDLEVGMSLLTVGPARVPGELEYGSQERQLGMRSERWLGITSCKVSWLRSRFGFIPGLMRSPVVGFEQGNDRIWFLFEKFICWVENTCGGRQERKQRAQSEAIAVDFQVFVVSNWEYWSGKVGRGADLGRGFRN